MLSITDLHLHVNVKTQNPPLPEHINHISPSCESPCSFFTSPLV
jgi:hypothetical protein